MDSVRLRYLHPRAERAIGGIRANSLLALGVLALGFLLHLYRNARWFMHDDEGGYLYAAWRIGQGEMPYRDFLTPQLPGFLYPGGLLLKLFGNSVFAIRVISALAVLLSGLFLYLTIRKILSTRTALLALVFFIVHADVYWAARWFRPEAYILLYGAVGIYLFVVFYPEGRRRGLVAAGAFFALATLTKFFGALPLAGCVLFVIYDAFKQPEARRQAAETLFWLLAPYAGLVGAIFALFSILTPEFGTAVLGHHLQQGSGLAWWQTIGKGLQFYWSYFWDYPFLVALAILAIVHLLSVGDRLKTFFVFQVPTAGAFLILTRSLQARHLVYLVPALCALAAFSFGPLSRHGVRETLPRLRRLTGLRPDTGANTSGQTPSRPSQLGLLALLAGLVILPSMQKNYWVASWQERDTWRLVSYIQAHTEPDDYVLSDYPGLNFYSRRKTTYLGAGLSGGATSSGQILGQELIREMENTNTKMVLINVIGGAHQLINLRDYDEFRHYLQEHYHLVGMFHRSYQNIEIYHQNDLIPLPLQANFGDKLHLTGADMGGETVESGGTLPIALRWQASQEVLRDYTASLRLVDEEGHLWGQQDTLMSVGFALTSNSYWESEEPIEVLTTSKWQPGEVMIDEYELPVFPATPPGKYQVEMLLYHLKTGDIINVFNEDRTPVARSFTLGSVEVRRTDSPPSPDDLNIQHPLNEQVSAGLRLLGYNLTADTVRPGQAFALSLFWQTLAGTEQDYALLLQLQDENGETQTEDVVQPANEIYPTSEWRAGDVLRGQHKLAVDAAVPAGKYRLLLNLVDLATGQPILESGLVLSNVTVVSSERLFTVPDIQHPMQASLGDRIAFLGYDLPRAQVAPGEALRLTLYWRAERSMDTSYTVFTHLLDPEQQIWGQKDSIPINGTHPTTGWLPGEVIVDEYDIPLEAEAPLGEYFIEIGMYDSETGQRLPVLREDGERVPDDRILLGTVQAQE